MEAIARARREGFSAEQFERHRRNRLGSFMRRFNSLEFVANNYLAYRFRGSDLFNYPAILHQITLEEVQSLLEESWFLKDTPSPSFCPKNPDGKLWRYATK